MIVQVKVGKRKRGVDVLGTNQPLHFPSTSGSSGSSMVQITLATSNTSGFEIPTPTVPTNKCLLGVTTMNPLTIVTTVNLSYPCRLTFLLVFDLAAERTDSADHATNATGTHRSTSSTRAMFRWPRMTIWSDVRIPGGRVPIRHIPERHRLTVCL